MINVNIWCWAFGDLHLLIYKCEGFSWFEKYFVYRLSLMETKALNYLHYVLCTGGYIRCSGLFAEYIHIYICTLMMLLFTAACNITILHDGGRWCIFWTFITQDTLCTHYSIWNKLLSTYHIFIFIKFILFVYLFIIFYMLDCWCLCIYIYFILTCNISTMIVFDLLMNKFGRDWLIICSWYIWIGTHFCNNHLSLWLLVANLRIMM